VSERERKTDGQQQPRECASFVGSLVRWFVRLLLDVFKSHQPRMRERQRDERHEYIKVKREEKRRDERIQLSAAAS